MSQIIRNFVVGECYHLYSRGVRKNDVFEGPVDFWRFLVLLYAFNNKESIRMDRMMKAIKGKGFEGVLKYVGDKDPLVEIGLYCLMNNHFHILVREIEKDGISVFMHKVLTSYSMYVNEKYGYSGSLFESTFQSKHVGNDEYMKYLHSYIHLNPLNYFEQGWKEKGGVSDLKGAQNFLRNYWYSSYLDFVGVDRPENLILNTSNFPDYFGFGELSFEEFIQEWLKYNNEF